MPLLILCRQCSVLNHVLLDRETQSYRVIVVGNSVSGKHDLVLEEFDPETLKWKVTKDMVPSQEFLLDEYQTSVFVKGIIQCITHG